MTTLAKSWIQTYTKRRFDPINPDPEQIDIRDIAHALSLVNRFGGHTEYAYSVAQHSVIVARNVPRPDALWGLLHDASEAYLADICRPVKPFIQGYKEAEEKLMRAIAERFDLPWPCPESVHVADRNALQTEMRDLMSPLAEGWPVYGTPFPERIEPWSADLAETRFLRAYEELTP